MRALTALLLLGPGTPMLFQGQEFAASAPFLTSPITSRSLRQLVGEGRRGVPAQFPSLARRRGAARALPDRRATRRRSTRASSTSPSARRNAEALSRCTATCCACGATTRCSAARTAAIDGAVLGPSGFVLRFFGGEHGDRLLLVNLGARSRPRAGAGAAARAAGGCRRGDCCGPASDPRYGGAGHAADRAGRRAGTCPGESARAASRRTSRTMQTHLDPTRSTSADAARPTQPTREAIAARASGSSPTASAATPPARSPGVVTRRYHGLLVAALPAPLGRMMMLNHLLGARAPAGRRRSSWLGGEERSRRADAADRPSISSEFRLELGLPVWRYEVDGVVIEKRRADAARAEHRARHLPAARRRQGRCG